MASLSLLPGFRFHPTDEELVAYYLRSKVHGRKIELEIILDVDIYKCEPWDLPEKSFLSGRDLEWYFFSPRDRKYPNGSRTNRATAAGYWKSTGKDRKVISDMRPIGMKKTLVFYTGRAPYGSRTNWVMHEYRLDKNECEASALLQDSYALCRVFKKGEAGPRTGEQCGTSTEIDFSFGMSNLLNKNRLLTVEEQYEENRSLLSHEQDQTNSLKEASFKIMNDINVGDGALTTTVQLLHYNSGSRSFHPLNESSYPKVLQGEHCKCSCPLLEVGNHIETYPSLSGSRMPNTYLGDERVLSFVEEAKMLEQLYQDVLIPQENNNVNRFINSDVADIV